MRDIDFTTNHECLKVHATGALFYLFLQNLLLKKILPKPNPQETEVIFTEEILNGELHFCALLKLLQANQ